MSLANAPTYFEETVTCDSHKIKRGAGIAGWIFSTDHKRIAMMYLVSMFTFFVVGSFLGILMRLEAMSPHWNFMPPRMYNSLFTLHGVIMIFLFVIPGLPATFGNFFLPLQIGAKDVAFPRLNLLSFWLFIIGALLAVASIFGKGSFADTGWTFYAPYSLETNANVSLAVFAAFILGWSSILTGINFATTIHRMRSPSMGWFQMPLFSWSLYATAWVQIVATPVVGITLLLVIAERVLNIGIFQPALGGDPVLFQHLFWIYSHPAVYVMVIPAMGAISEIIPVFSRKTIFGYRAIALSSMSIAILGYFVWAHHMFTAGLSDTAVWIFSLLTFFVAIPTAVKIFNWVATLYLGSIELAPPMLYALSFVFLFSIGGLTGLANAAVATDIHIHDTAYVVGHFHYTMFGGTGFGMFAALAFWFPKMFGVMYDQVRAKWAFALQFIGFNLLYFPMLILGVMGMPRRYYTYPIDSGFQPLHVVSAIGSWLLVIGLLLMIYNYLKALWEKSLAPENPWGGLTLEWQVSSPPPLENFHEIPHPVKGPYEFEGEWVK